MPFFKKMKSAFGFGPDEDNDSELYDDVDNDAGDDSATGDSAPTDGLSGDSDTAQAMQARIFDHVVAVFNKSLPDFLNSSVNPQAQSKYLYDTLQADVRQYLNTIAEATEQRCQRDWAADRENLQRQVKELGEKAREIEIKRAELDQRQLSTERQRRSLSDRVHDLEKQIMNLEAEKEQYQLEGKSMANKLKVSGVYEEDNAKMRQEINDLRAQLARARAQAVQQPAAEGQETPDAKAEVEVQIQPDPADKAAIAELKGKLESTEAELLNTMGQLDDANKQLADVQTKLDETSKQLDETHKQLNETHKQLNESNKQLDDANAKLQDCVTAEQLEQLEQQLSQFEAVKAKKDSRIAELKKNERMLAEDNRQLRRQLDQALARAASHADSHGDAADNAAGQTVAEPPIEDILSDTDWLVTPAKPAARGAERRGGHSSRRKDPNDNPDQMSLF